MGGRAGKWVLLAAPVALSVSACMGWGGYPPATNVREAQLVGTWRARECAATVTLNADGTASLAGVPAEMGLDSRVTRRIDGRGAWEIDESDAGQELDVVVDDEATPFDLYRDNGRLVVGLTVGDPDEMNWCTFDRAGPGSA
ncbi:hypothetical protein ACWELO_03055 [Streptomyces sp. NPDC004596]